MTTLGEAFIEVHADTRPFAKELNAEVSKIVAGLAKLIKPDSIKAGAGISEGIAEGVTRNSSKVKDSLGKVGDSVDTEAKRWAKALKEPFERLAKGNFILTRIFGQMVTRAGALTGRLLRLGKTVVGLTANLAEFATMSGVLVAEGFKNMIGVGGDVSRALTGIGSSGARVGASLAALGAELAAFAPIALALVAVVGLLIAAFAALAAIIIVAAAPFAMLLNFALALPAALSVLLAIIGPLILAFSDLSDAMELVFEKDPKKFADGLKGLNSPMAALVKTLRSFAPALKQVKDSVQTAFFDPIIKQLGPTLRALLPVILGGFTQIAGAVGGLIANIMKFMQDPAFVSFLAELTGAVADAIVAFGPAMVAILQALAAASQAALPLVLTLIEKFGGFLIEFGKWLEGAISDGRFQKFLDDAIASAKSIWNLIKALIGLFSEMFAQTDEGGRRFLDKITQAVNKFTAWLKSPEGKKALENAVALANAFADAFAIALESVKTTLWVINRIMDAIRWIRNNPIGSALSGAAGIISDQFSGGGVVPRDEIALVHKGEPILDPANSVSQNRSILAEAGMLDVLEGATVVNVYLGTERLEERIDYRIGRNNRANATALKSGPR